MVSWFPMILGVGEIVAPFDCQVLHLSILVVQRLDDTINRTCGYVIVVVQKVGFAVRQYLEQIVERHEPEVRVGISQLLDELDHRLGRRVLGHARGSHLVR